MHIFQSTGNFCPICRLCYSDDDWECKMIGCSTCDSWTHSKCENLPGKFSIHTSRHMFQCNKILSDERAWCITRDRVGLCIQKWRKAEYILTYYVKIWIPEARVRLYLVSDWVRYCWQMTWYLLFWASS